jgi:hypothetical protein
MKVIEVEKPSPEGKIPEISKQLSAGVIYGEVVYWGMLVSLIIAITGFIIYMRYGGFFNSQVLLDYLWAGSSSNTIWSEVGHVSEPIPWYNCVTMLSKGDMIALFGVAIAGSAAIVGMWGTFLGTVRNKNGIYIIFSLLISIVLTLSALGIIKLHA